MNKFKVGDKVRTASGIDGVVTKIQGAKIFVKSVYGMELSYKEEDLKFRYPDLEDKPKLNMEYVGDKCPRCRTPWTITRWGHKAWYHCKQCKKKAEDLILGSSEPPPLPNTKGSSSDEPSTLEDWDDFLNQLDFNDGDYDDWF